MTVNSFAQFSDDDLYQLIAMIPRMDSIEHRLDLLQAHLSGQCLDDCPCWKS
jgi:hypothetical protein